MHVSYSPDDWADNHYLRWDIVKNADSTTSNEQNITRSAYSESLQTIALSYQN